MREHVAFPDEDLVLYLEGSVDGVRAGEIDAHVRGCERCSRRLTELRAAIVAVGDVDDELLAVDLLPAVRREVGTTPAPIERRGWTMWASGAVVGALASAAVIALVVLPFGGEPEVRVKSGASPHPWTGVTTYRVVDEQALEVGDSMAAADRLVFSYVNADAAPFEYLMVFARDAAGTVHWYYPAYTEAGSDPHSIRIVGGVRGERLPDEVRHSLAPGPMDLWALFSREPLRVSQVERSLARVPPELPFDDAVAQRRRIQVR